MTAHARTLQLKSRRPTPVSTVLAAITVMLAGMLGFADMLHAQNGPPSNSQAFHASFGRSVHEADTQRAFPAVSFTPPTPAYTAVASAGLIINATYAANVDAATQNVINNVINFYESSITTPITVNIEFHGMASGLGSSFFVFYTGPYSSFRTALATVAFSADDMTALANTPAGATNPVNGGANIAVKSANGRAVGLSTPEVSLNFPGSPCPAFTGAGCIGINVALANAHADLVAVVEHEIDEILGLGSALSGTTTPAAPWAQDLFRWASPGVRSYAANPSTANPCTATPNAFFSINGGVTNLNQFNNCANGGDYGDWITHTPSQVQDAFNNFSGSPTLTLTTAEVRNLDVIGWNLLAPGTLAKNRDFNGDGRSDILWRNTSSGAVFEWQLNGTAISGSGSPGGATTDWTIAGVGDFDANGRADILWRHTSGAVFIWLLNGSSIIGAGSPGGAGVDWSIAGVGDFNGDGRSDILWRQNTGAVFIWEINGSSIIGAGSPGGAGVDWSIAGVGDFNGDGLSDILWRQNTGAVFIWEINGTSIIGTGSPGGAGLDWSIAGVGDFNGDGRSDILWRQNTGAVWEWQLNGPSVSASGAVGGATTDWTIAKVGDYDGDGKFDILWRQTGGQVFEWQLNGFAVIGSGAVGSATTDWQIQ